MPGLDHPDADKPGRPGRDGSGTSPPDLAPREIDARDMLCPLPVLRLRKVLAGTPPGRLVRLIATDPAAVIDVPHFCDQAGHVLIATDSAPDGARVFTVRRG
ncbi:sulfurtransferase TusA family protein [uncultured Paracoccus sp.]|uniref:sulfurtransferase TusA family protein n=1 Tax=uncultured Paracoccus sp. TaxID=189685 RepID=UPI00345A7823